VSLSPPRRIFGSVLAAWTGAQVILVVSSIRSIPPVVLMTILPYLALVGWYLLSALTQRNEEQERLSDESGSVPDPSPVSLESALPASDCLDARAVSPEPPARPPTPSSEPRTSTAGPARARRRVKPRAVGATSPPSWVQVGPGRFIRDDEVEPPPDPSRILGPMPDEAPRGDPPADGSSTVPLMADQTPGLEAREANRELADSWNANRTGVEGEGSGLLIAAGEPKFGLGG
jgi:hypothetical protein